MIKSILTTLALSMVLSSLSCLTLDIDLGIDDFSLLGFNDSDETGTGTTRKITGPLPTNIGSGTNNFDQYTYTLYYVNASEAYPDVAAPQDIASILPELPDNLADLKNITGSIYSRGKLAGQDITFVIENLVVRTLYLFFVEASHRSEDTEDTIYTPITENKGWFKTEIATPRVFTLQSTSDGVSDGATLPARYYGTETISDSGLSQQRDAENISPQLSWSNPPSGTNGYLIVMYDPTSTSITNWLHWIRKENASVSSVAEGVGTTPDASKQYPTNSSAQEKYAGPQPPSEDAHNYIFRIFALDTAITDESITAGNTRYQTSAIRDSLNKNVGDNLVDSIQILGIASLSVNAALLP